jgi:hypothetical protein
MALGLMRLRRGVDFSKHPGHPLTDGARAFEQAALRTE